MGRRVNGFRAAITDAGFAVDLKLVAFGVSAKIIVIIKDKDFRVRVSFSVKIRRSQPTNPGSDNDQIIARFS